LRAGRDVKKIKTHQHLLLLLLLCFIANNAWFSTTQDLTAPIVELMVKRVAAMTNFTGHSAIRDYRAYS